MTGTILTSIFHVVPLVVPTPFPEVYLLVTGHQELVLGDLAGYPFQLKLDAVVQDEPVCHLCLDHELEEESQWHQLKPKKLV